MGLLNYLCKRFTPVELLDETRDKLELAFFGPVYRVIYFTGFSSTERGMFYLMYSGIAKLQYVLFIAWEFWWLYAETTVDGYIECISVTLIQVITIYKYWIMIQNKSFYKSLTKAMESPNFDISTPGRQQIVDYWRQTNDKSLKLVLLLGTFTLAAWHLYPLVDDIEYNLVLGINVPYDYKTPKLYGVTYFLVSYIFTYAAYFVMMNDAITQSHLIHLLCQYSVLGDCFEKILDDCSVVIQDSIDTTSLHKNEAFTQKYFRRLGTLVEQHQFLLNNTLKLRNILSMPMLGQFSASAMLICCTAYQVTTAITAGLTKFLMCLLFLGYNLIQLFILCRWCDEIKVYSERIREAVYFSGWERVAMVPGVRARLMLVIARASRPLVLTAGGLYDLSLNSYATLVKTSYSALTVLMRTQKN